MYNDYQTKKGNKNKWDNNGANLFYLESKKDKYMYQLLGKKI